MVCYHIKHMPYRRLFHSYGVVYYRLGRSYCQTPAVSQTGPSGVRARIATGLPFAKLENNFN